jgi:hypothetical protein
LGGRKKPTVAPLGLYELKQKLLSLNSEDLPYTIKSLNETDLEIECKIADAKWFAIFGKNQLKKIYQSYFVLDDLLRTVRYCEKIITVKWASGLGNALQPTISYQKESVRGKVLSQKSWEMQAGIKEDLTLGKVYEYKFDTGYIRDPIKKLIVESGWEFVPVLRKDHATCKSLKK